MLAAGEFVEKNRLILIVRNVLHLLILAGPRKIVSLHGAFFWKKSEFILQRGA